jgi:hypothetical protein
MPLPPVDGWLIDFRTARAIFSSGSNERISHCVEMCATSKLHFPHCEEKLFKSDPSLKAPFIDQQNCLLEPDDDVFERCLAIDGNPVRQRLLQGNDAAIFMTAAALAKNLGVISDAEAHSFATVRELCDVYGIPNVSSDEYFAALG